MLKLEDLHGAIHGFESLSEAARKAGVSTAHMAHAMKQFRQEYPCDWNEDPDDLVTITDMNGNSLEFVRRRCEPKVKIEFCGYPITIREKNPGKNDHILIEAWEPDRENRTPPLVSETFTRSAFFEAICEARAASCDFNYGMHPQSGEEAFILAWGQKNMREIERTYMRRGNGVASSFTDYGVRESQEQIAERKRKLEEAERLRQEAEDRKERELLTAIPEWGAF
jgi:hypothetical protein